MKKRTGIIGILIAILVLGIGYAAITTIPLVISGTGKVLADQDNFVVEFVDPITPEITQTYDSADNPTVTAEIGTDTTTASISIDGFKHQEDQVTITYTVANNSVEEIDAELKTPEVDYDNQEYISVVATLADTTLSPGDTTTCTVVVTALKPAVNADVTSNIEITIDADPVA